METLYTLEVFAVCGGQYFQSFSDFEKARMECDRLNYCDDWAATLYDASGAAVRNWEDQIERS